MALQLMLQHARHHRQCPAMRIVLLLKAGSLYSIQNSCSKALRGCAAHRIASYPGSIPSHPFSYSNRVPAREIDLGSRVFHGHHPQLPQRHEPWALKDTRRAISEAAVAQVDDKVPLKDTSEQADVQEPVKPECRPIIYRGPMSETLRKVKILSLTSCCLSAMTAPLLIFFASPQLTSVLKGGAAATVMALSVTTTAALHWFVGPYVHKLIWKPGQQEMELEMVTWMATYERRKINISDVGPPKSNRPFVTFAAKGYLYFVDPQKINKDLYRLLTFFKGKK